VARNPLQGVTFRSCKDSWLHLRSLFVIALDMAVISLGEGRDFWLAAGEFSCPAPNVVAQLLPFVLAHLWSEVLLMLVSIGGAQSVGDRFQTGFRS